MQAGEVVGLLGPNGAGKSTVLACLAGLLPADGGAVHDGRGELPAGRRRETLFYLPDGIAPWPEQRAAWVLDFHTRLAGGAWRGAAGRALAVTLGAWALDCVGQVKGGALLAAARFTPEAALRTFEHGEPRLDVTCVTLAMIAARLALAVAPIAARARASGELSEDRRNSLRAADARALATFPSPLVVEAHLAPEDPRLADLRRGVLHELERTMPAVRITTVTRTSTGLFEPPDGHYGEVSYALRDRRVMSRSTTEPIVLETIYQLAGRTPPTPDPETPYPGYPLHTDPRGAALLFYGAWPAVVLLGWWIGRRRRPVRISRARHRFPWNTVAA